MNETAKVRRYVFRQSRAKVAFPVDFLVGGEIFHGVCRNTSDAGIRAEFDRSLVVGSSGLLVLHRLGAALKLEARVAYMDAGDVGLEFTFKSNLVHARVIGFIAPTHSAINNETSD